MVPIKTIKIYLQKSIQNLLVFLKWVLFACAIGLIVGIIGILFHYGIYYATNFRQAQPWILWFLPFGGLLIVFLYKICGMDKDKGTNFVLIAVRANEKLSLKTAPLIFISTIITHLFGGSAGREGAALQIGGSIAAKIGRIMKLDEKDSRIITMCGMSAAFAALFGTPLTATVFAMEVVSVGVIYYAALVPCILSSIIGYMLSSACGVATPYYFITQIPELSATSVIQAIMLGILCALFSILFCYTTHKTAALYSKYLPNQYIRIAAGGAIIVALTFICGTQDYNGVGTNIINQALSSEVRPEAFLLKLLFTALTLGAGFKGGEIVPVFFTGATLGNICGKFLGLNPAFGGALGLIGVFCGVTNCTMTSLFLSVELFGTQGLLYFAIICAVSYMLSGYYGLYLEQKIVYSKTKPEFINKKAH